MSSLRQLWATGDSAARLLALLICRPRSFSQGELDAMLRDARVPKVQDWLVNYVVKKSPHVEALRVSWFDDPDPVIASAGWGAHRRPGGEEAGRARPAGSARPDRGADGRRPERLQWAMNACLAQIGIEHPEYRARALEIGERLEVLKDYPTSPGCTSPFAPIWITEMVETGRAGLTGPGSMQSVPDLLHLGRSDRSAPANSAVSGSK